MKAPFLMCTTMSYFAPSSLPVHVNSIQGYIIYTIAFFNNPDPHFKQRRVIWHAPVEALLTLGSECCAKNLSLIHDITKTLSTVMKSSQGLFEERFGTPLLYQSNFLLLCKLQIDSVCRCWCRSVLGSYMSLYQTDGMQAFTCVIPSITGYLIKPPKQ